MNLGDQRAGGIDDAKLAFPGFFAHARRNAMRAENQHSAYRNFFNGFDENRAAAAELIDDVAIVDDFVMDVNGAAIGFKRQFDDIDGANYAGAKAARAHPDQRLGAIRGPMDLR